MTTPADILRDLRNTAQHRASSIDHGAAIPASAWADLAAQLDVVLEQLTATAGADYEPPTVNGITLTGDELDALTAWSRSSQQHGGFRVWLEHDTAVEAATRILAARLEVATTAMAQQRLVVLPAEHIALTVGLAQVLRGEAPDPNVAAMCVLALARLTGRHDWTDQPELEAQGDNDPKKFPADVTPEMGPES